MFDYELLDAGDKVVMLLERVVDLGNRVLVVAKQIGRGRSSGVNVELEVAMVFALRGGKIARLDAYGDRAEALKAVGLI